LQGFAPLKTDDLTDFPTPEPSRNIRRRGLRHALEDAMTRTTTLFLTAAAVALVGGLGWSYAAEEPDLITVAKQLSHQWIDAYNKRDAATLASLYINDAIVTAEGQPGLRKFFEQNLKRSAVTNLQVTRSDLTDVRAEVVFGRGIWSGDVQNGGEVTHVTGTYLAIGTKGKDGEWKFLGVDWNLTPLPIAAPATPAAQTAGSGTDEQPHSGTSVPAK
jgi:ketosteroid isomerase-like protein